MANEIHLSVFMTLESLYQRHGMSRGLHHAQQCLAAAANEHGRYGKDQDVRVTSGGHHVRVCNLEEEKRVSRWISKEERTAATTERRRSRVGQRKGTVEMSEKEVIAQQVKKAEVQERVR